MHTGHLFEHFKPLQCFDLLNYFPVVGTYYLVSSHVINQQFKDSF